MAKNSTSKSRDKGPRHIIELPLMVTEADRHILERRFPAANHLRNGVAQEAFRALDACRSDPAWAAARLLPRKTKAERETRGEAFTAVRDQHGLTEAGLSLHERRIRSSCWIGDHITARLGQVIVKEVLKAIDNHLFRGAGRPRFRKADDCRTISARQPNPMMLKGGVDDGLVLHWSKLQLRIRRNEFSESDRYSLSCSLVHCRVKRIPSGHVAPRSAWRYAVQVVVKGKPFVHQQRAATGVVGIDTGPAMVGAVWRDGPAGPGYKLIPLAVEVERNEAVIRCSSRRLDRQRRAANPHCFDDKGRWRKGKRIRHQSNRNKAEMASRRRGDAKAATHRRKCHGRDTNKILANACEVRLEDHGYVGWTRLWGRAMGRGAPALFVSELKRKCLDAGGSVVMINNWRAALSQVDVINGGREKKPLRQRYHKLGDGSGFVQRDLHSALLASRCDAAGTIDLGSARADLEALCQGLVRSTAALAVRDAEAARAKAMPAPRPNGRQSGSNESRGVPATGETGLRRLRRRDWLRGRIATRRARCDQRRSEEIVVGPAGLDAFASG